MASERNNNVSVQLQDQSTLPTDAFSKYSDDATRLRALLLIDDDEEFDLRDFAERHYGTGRAVNIEEDHGGGEDRARKRINSSRECNPQDDGCQRKTRISFEVHPSLMLDDIFLELPQEAERIDTASGDSGLLALLDALSR